ncbi:MAG: hypothetical protein ACP5KS_05850 [Candidatus Hydrogenedens sp.]
MSNSTKLKTIWIKLSGHSYPIHVGVGILPQLSEELVRLNWKGKIGIITDTNVANYYLNICEELVKKVCPQGYVIHILPAGEEYKTIQQIEDMCTTML